MEPLNVPLGTLVRLLSSGTGQMSSLGQIILGGRYWVAEDWRVWLAGDAVVLTYAVDDLGRDPNDSEAVAANPYAMHRYDAALQNIEAVDLAMSGCDWFAGAEMPRWASRLEVQVTNIEDRQYHKLATLEVVAKIGESGPMTIPTETAAEPNVGEPQAPDR